MSPEDCKRLSLRCKSVVYLVFPKVAAYVKVVLPTALECDPWDCLYLDSRLYRQNQSTVPKHRTEMGSGLVADKNS